ncbi:UDP-N-acetylmuramate dehydrogenase [Porphyromonas crevioricanis]|uniref:UDP-N-acetylenolpyruvoylglucosamine reductase n=1 Tax=Porphyromonas crevioricanis TaxID=393921 RepID=A0AB34PFW5_9PORP|nr:UDP-N-acetylmuramate dehydrogenase [Porphyromonas crevioricanis]KGN95312.1 hypothetical protein HQ38_03160 [Porphyromonas crevioricanis]
MEILQNQSLRPLNTFDIDAQCSYLLRYDSLEDLKLLQRDEFVAESKTLIIGEGSNMLFLANFHGIVLVSGMKEISPARPGQGVDIYLEVDGGVSWDSLVAHCVQQGFYGTENLSLIPGTVGAAARQNIGAYGVELSSLVEWVDAFDLSTGEQRRFAVSELCYAYRYSVFKEPDMQKWVIYRVCLRLSTDYRPNLAYADLAGYFKGKALPTAAQLREAVIEIRNNKLPEVGKVGSAGSFFMNPILENTQLIRLLQIAPDVTYYPLSDGRAKVSAAWLIDHAGLRGYRNGAVGVWDRQALVLCNYGGGTGTQIGELASHVQQVVKEKYEVDLQPEVNYVC